MDDILDAALDELADSDDENEGQEQSKTSQATSAQESGDEGRIDVPKKCSSGERCNVVSGVKSKKENRNESRKGDGKDETTSKRKSARSVTRIDETLAALVEGMSNQSVTGNPGAPPDPSDDSIDGEELFQKMMHGLQNNMASIGNDIDGGSDVFNADAVIDGMMEQIMCKDLMYEPMKQVAERFPSWLKDNKSRISADEYEQRSNQFDGFKKLVYVYETDPGNTSQLIELMQQVQEYGQPPQEIMNDIAPGLELDEDGTPNLPPFNGLAFNDEGEECVIS